MIFLTFLGADNTFCKYNTENFTYVLIVIILNDNTINVHISIFNVIENVVEYPFKLKKIYSDDSCILKMHFFFFFYIPNVYELILDHNE